MSGGLSTWTKHKLIVDWLNGVLCHFQNYFVISWQQLTNSCTFISWASPVLGWALKCLARGFSWEKTQGIHCGWNLNLVPLGYKSHNLPLSHAGPLSIIKWIHIKILCECGRCIIWWMDRCWMDNRWKKGWVDGWMISGWMNWQMDRQMDAKWKNAWMPNGQMDGKMDESPFSRISATYILFRQLAHKGLESNRVGMGVQCFNSFPNGYILDSSKLFFPQCFQKICTADTYKPGLVWERVKVVIYFLQ